MEKFDSYLVRYHNYNELAKYDLKISITISDIKKIR